MYYYLVTCDGFFFDLIKSHKFLNNDNVNSYMEEKLKIKNKEHLKYYIRQYWSESTILKH